MSRISRSNQSRQLSIVSTKTALVQLIILLSYLVFMIDHTRSNPSKQLSFVFGIYYTCTIDQLVVLIGFCQRLHLVDRSQQLSFIFDKNHTYTISHIEAQLVKVILQFANLELNVRKWIPSCEINLRDFRKSPCNV